MNILCVLSLFASLLKYRLVIICMNVLVCVMAAKCRHLFSVLTCGPVTVGAQRGTCHMRTGCGGPEVKTQRCMHRFVWMCFVLNDMFLLCCI